MLGPVAAIVLRRMGARRMMGLGAIIAAVSAFAGYFMNTLPQFYMTACILALGSTMLGGVACTHTLTNWFARKRALALGVYMSTGGLAAFASAPAITYLVQATGSWRNAWLAIMLAIILAGVIAILFVRNDPEDKATFVDGIDPSTAPANSTASKVQRRIFQTDISWDVKEAARTAPFWIIVLASSTAVFGILMVNSQGILHFRDMGIAPLTAASVIGIIGLFGAGGRLLSGLLGDRIEPRYLYSFGLTLELIGILLLIKADTVFLAYATALITGLGNGMALVANPALMANYFGSRNFAGLMSIHGFIVIIIGSLSPYIASLVFEILGSYTPRFLSFAVISVLPALFLLWMRPPQHKAARELSLQPAE